MTRHFETDPSVEISDAKNNHQSQIYDIKVVTPMFGGGVVAGENDPSMLIRATSIRGHLRFWWRATRGTTYPEMREAENKIWGSTEISSKVGVRVNITNSGSKFVENHPAYALFPFQGKKEHGKIKEEPKSGTVNIEFQLQLSYPETLQLKIGNTDKIIQVNNEVEAAVWAWVNFGGIGARTRRGCGTLFCKVFAPENQNKICEWFKNHLQKYGVQQKIEDWLTLSQYMYIGDQMTKPMIIMTKPMIIWDQVISVYRNFRQGKNIGRNEPAKGSRSPAGRSRWTEPDAIRRITKTENNQHRQSITGNVNVFPRAEFGLPIIFHFQGSGEPNDTELCPFVNGNRKERMGSPLILKPLILADDNVVPCVLCMNGKQIDKVELNKSGSKSQFRVCSPQAANYNASPLKNRSTNGSALEAFKKYLTEPDQNFNLIGKQHDDRNNK
ncbi:MAG: type III-B CRISPR module RAMP protein Cmr1 [Planctomycetaceae bacterium]|jgi:CRISPR-associated protein Cmr1|nr:type III-B CRISPR module RAMP protein Cmr1 [Planctomycetaceae bacterium]